ncbi:MAG: hypothetical protein IKF75_00775 [Lachnospiraceae bacterium]|nr:hypothetical protein [Lachnospiraceae bacterium]
MKDNIFKEAIEIQMMVGEPALYEGMAEEAIELAHAALKTARILRGENPTPARYENAKMAVTEEYSDLETYAHTLGVAIDPDIYREKKERMLARIREAKG